MEISLHMSISLSFSRFPSLLFPPKPKQQHQQQNPPPPLLLHNPIPKISTGDLHRPSAIKRSGLLSAIDHAIEEEEEYRKARAEVNRKGIGARGYVIEGFSVGGHETCVVIPALNSVFDIGRCPSRAVHQDFLFITHAHLDHIGGLPMYVATWGLYNLKPPTVFVPPCIKADVEKLFDVHRAMSRVELNLDLVALDVGETYEIRNDLVVRPFKTHHVIPSQATFLDEEMGIEHARQHGHMHLFEILENAQWIRNESIMLAHFSSRYKIEDIHEAVSKLQRQVRGKVLALTGGFKSTYT